LKSILNELEVDPFSYVENLHSPIGIYLRREVFQKEVDTNLGRALRGKIVADQSADGSWNQHFVKTANNLWNLYLLGYGARDVSVKKGLEWLLTIQRHQYRGYPGFFLSGNRSDAQAMRSNVYGEFGPGCTIFYQTAYAVHLFHLFGFDDNLRVQTAVKSYLQFWRPNWCGAWCTINVLRVLIEHRLSAGSEQVERGIKSLARRQTKRGSWKGFPFYHTFHALSRAEHALAKRQLKKAFRSVVKRQNEDGSWGEQRRETESFLVLAALKNVDALQHVP
jgi:hypothetical protein